MIQLLKAHLDSSRGENLHYLKLLYDYIQLVRSEKAFFYDETYFFDLEPFMVRINGFISERIEYLNRDTVTHSPGAHTNGVVEGLINLVKTLIDINSMAWSKDTEIERKLKTLFESTFKDNLPYLPYWLANYCHDKIVVGDKNNQEINFDFLSLLHYIKNKTAFLDYSRIAFQIRVLNLRKDNQVIDNGFVETLRG